MWKEFKEFAFKGNVVDLAVGVIIGGAFQAIVSSLVKDIITPIITVLIKLVTGNSDLESLAWNGITYGNFISAILDFFIVAFCLFLFVKYINKLNNINKGILDNKLLNKLNKKSKKVQDPVPEPTTKVCKYCLSEIAFKATRCPHCTSILEEKIESLVK